MFETKPVGGPKNQPKYINAVVVLDGSKLAELTPCEANAIELLESFLALEMRFGRNRSNSNIPWGPRSLDIDLLAWGDLQIKNKKLTLPHPRIIERSFVVVPLAAALTYGEESPKRIDPQQNWIE